MRVASGSDDGEVVVWDVVSHLLLPGGWRVRFVNCIFCLIRFTYCLLIVCTNALVAAVLTKLAKVRKV